MKLHQVFRITTFVPPSDLDRVLEAILSQTPLRYGLYDKSCWWSAGTEQYEPIVGAKPTHGEIGQTERVATVRLEFVIPAEEVHLQDVLEALLTAHPWQEPAVFVDRTTITLSTGQDLPGTAPNRHKREA